MSEIVQVSEVKAVHQSRWGFHPCSFQMFRKLKQLAVVVRRCERICAQHRRWFRKAERNRVARRRIRNEKGWVVGYGDAVPIPEPAVVAPFSVFDDSMSQVDVNGTFHQQPVLVRRMRLTDLARQIMKDRDRAAAPRASAAEVEHLSLSEAQVTELHVRFVGGE